MAHCYADAVSFRRTLMETQRRCHEKQMPVNKKKSTGDKDKGLKSIWDYIHTILHYMN